MTALENLKKIAERAIQAELGSSYTPSNVQSMCMRPNGPLSGEGSEDLRHRCSYGNKVDWKLSESLLCGFNFFVPLMNDFADDV